MGWNYLSIPQTSTVEPLKFGEWISNFIPRFIMDVITNPCCLFSTSRGVPVYSQIRVSLESDGCRDERTNEVLYLEHVQSIITLTSSRRGQVGFTVWLSRLNKMVNILQTTFSEHFDEWKVLNCNKIGSDNLIDNKDNQHWFGLLISVRFTM